jgi:hypothetical protein
MYGGRHHHAGTWKGNPYNADQQQRRYTLKAVSFFRLLVTALALTLATTLGGIVYAQPIGVPASGCQEAAVLTIEQAINPGTGGFTQDRVLVPGESTTEVLGGWVLLDAFKVDPTVLGTSFNCTNIPDGNPLFVTKLIARPVAGDSAAAGLKTITFWADNNFDGFFNPGIDTQLGPPMDAACLKTTAGCVLSFGITPIFGGLAGLGPRLVVGPLALADFGVNAGAVLVIGDFDNPAPGAVLQISLRAEASDIVTNPIAGPFSSSFAPGYQRQASGLRLVVQGTPPAGGGVLSPAINNGSGSPETGVKGLSVLGIRNRDDRDVFTDRDARAGDREYLAGFVNLCEGSEPVTSNLTVLPPIAAAAPTIAGYPGVATCIGLALNDGLPTNVTGFRVGLTGSGAQYVQNVHVYVDLGTAAAIAAPGTGGVLFEPGELILSQIPDPVGGGFVARIGSIQQVLTTSGGTPLIVPNGVAPFPPLLFYVTLDLDTAARESDVVMEVAIDIADTPGVISSRLLRGTVQTFNIHVKGVTGPPSGRVRDFDTNGNGVIDDSEFFTAIDRWVGGTVSDDLFFRVLDAWVAQSPVGAASASAASLESLSLKSVALSSTHRATTFVVDGQGIDAMGVEIFGLDGQRVFAQQAAGTRLTWNLSAENGQSVANGVYLYVVTVRGSNGQALRSNVQKLVVLR